MTETRVLKTTRVVQADNASVNPSSAMTEKHVPTIHVILKLAANSSATMPLVTTAQPVQAMTNVTMGPVRVISSVVTTTIHAQMIFATSYWAAPTQITPFHVTMATPVRTRIYAKTVVVVEIPWIVRRSMAHVRLACVREAAASPKRSPATSPI